jgi:hypothetical protein
LGLLLNGPALLAGRKAGLQQGLRLPCRVCLQVEVGCQALVRAARQRWLHTRQGYVDDITAVVIFLGGGPGG